MRFLAVFLCACSTGSATDGGLDATGDAPADLCDLDAFFEAGGNGHACAFPSQRACFMDPQCATTYCRCVASPSGPVWKCMTGCPPEAGADAATE